MLKNYVLNVFIVFAFFLSQIVNVQANYASNKLQKENFYVSATEHKINKTVSMDALYVSNFLDQGTENEGKIEKVVEPITIGVLSTTAAFGLGFSVGSIMAAVSAMIGILIAVVKGSK
ncbi:hypothetical protein [Bartonella sp. B41]